VGGGGGGVGGGGGGGGGGWVKAGLDFSIARYPVEANGVTNGLYMGMYSVQEVHNQWYAR